MLQNIVSNSVKRASISFSVIYPGLAATLLVNVPPSLSIQTSPNCTILGMSGMKQSQRSGLSSSSDSQSPNKISFFSYLFSFGKKTHLPFFANNGKSLKFFKADDEKEGEMLLVPLTLGDVGVIKLDGSAKLLIQKGFLCADENVILNVNGFFNPILTASGNGNLALSCSGNLIRVELRPGEEYIVQKDYLIARDDNLDEKLLADDGKTIIKTITYDNNDNNDDDDGKTIEKIDEEKKKEGGILTKSKKAITQSGKNVRNAIVRFFGFDKEFSQSYPLNFIGHTISRFSSLIFSKIFGYSSPSNLSLISLKATNERGGGYIYMTSRLQNNNKPQQVPISFQLSQSQRERLSKITAENQQ